MSIVLIVLLILVVITVLILLYGVKIFNELVRLRTMVKEAWSGIEVQLKKRHDLIPNLVETVKGYASHESETLEGVINARSKALGATDLKSQETAENNLNSALTRLLAVVERYPDLKANENFLRLQNDLSVIESDIEKSRRYYNGAVRNLNIRVSTFPSNIVANMFNFTPEPFFELQDKSEGEAPKVQF